MMRYRPGIRIGVLLAMAVALSGCPEVPQLNPPQLYMEPLPPHVTNLKVENGAGDVLYDGKHPGSGKLITENPTPQQLDGTMTITRTYDDGQVKKQTLTYEAGKPVNIGYKDSTDSYYVKETPVVTMPQFYGGLRPALQYLDRPETPIVRKEQGGAVTGFVNADNDSTRPQFNGFVGFKMDQPFFGLGKKWGLELQGSYYSAESDDGREFIPASGGNLAVYAPLTGGGFGTGGNDLSNVVYMSDYTAWNIQPRFSKSYDVGSLYGHDLRMNSYVGFNYGKNEDDQTLSGTVNGAGDFTTVNAIDNWYYGPEFGFYSAWDWCPETKITLGGHVNFNVNELSANRRISSTLGFNNSDELDDTEYTVGGGINLELHRKISDIISARVGFQYERQENTPVINVDNDTGEASVDAEGSNAYQFYVGIKVDY